MEGLVIRAEVPADHRAVEEMTREAFWNVYAPGCEEHYLVHCLRTHPDFIPGLALVAQLEGRLVGNVMYAKCRLTDEEGREKEILPFGPLTVHPDYQRRGIGKALLKRSFDIAREMGYEAVVIFGNPGNYVGRGVQSCKKFGVSTPTGKFPCAMLVKELAPGALAGHRWVYRESPAYEADPAGFEAFDAAFPPKKKGWRPSQEEFYIYSHSALQ